MDNMIMIPRSEYGRLQYTDGIIACCKLLVEAGNEYVVEDIVYTLLLGVRKSNIAKPAEEVLF